MKKQSTISDDNLVKKGKYNREKLASAYGYESNKDVKFKYITGLHIQKFRSLENRDVKLGKQLTLITGKNGTMKSSILGLVAHPFSSPNNAKDMYGKDLKTSIQDVFRLSLEKDKDEYIYYLQGITDKNEEISEPVRIYLRENEERHRLTVGATNAKGQGNFHLNTSYLGLKRLYPIIETTAEVAGDVNISEEDKRKIADAYICVMQRSAYKSVEPISDEKKTKNTLAPSDSYYDFNSISSGEDNLGNILGKMLAFEHNCTGETGLQGLLCIDEIESSLHPSAQVNLIDFMLAWAKKYHIQVVATTHSVHIIAHCLDLQLKNAGNRENIIINNISTQQVGDDHNYHVMINPDYNTIYKELTLHDGTESELYKVNIICEDKAEKEFLKRILNKNAISKNINYLTDLSNKSGSSWTYLIALAKNGKKLLDDSIIVVDPDVPDNALEGCDEELVTKIPNPDTLLYSIERRIAYYVLNLDGANNIFAQKEKAAVIDSLSHHRILETNIMSNDSATCYKEWAKKESTFYKAARKQYIQDNKKLFMPFREKILEMINRKRSKRALPPIVIKA